MTSILGSLFTLPLALLRTSLAHLVPGTSPINEWDHFAPHPSSGFEGFYSRTQLEDGGTLAIIFCSVKNAKARGHMVLVSYHSVDQSDIPDFQRAFFVDSIDSEVNGYAPNRQISFILKAPRVGTFEVTPTSMAYKISVPDDDLDLSADLTNLVPWSRSRPLEGPMGALVHLSHLLPLNWAVHSTTSEADIRLCYAGHTRHMQGTTHVEKNWGMSFPTGWIWSQSFGEGGKSLAIAGGAALPGVQAYLVGYRSAKCAWDFRPPFTVGIGPLSPFMSVRHDSREGSVHLVLSTFTRKLVVRVEAPEDTFVPFPAPLREGHRLGFARESFKGRTWVEAWTRCWPWQRWTLLEDGWCGVTASGQPCSALEFGGSFSHTVTAA